MSGHRGMQMSSDEFRNKQQCLFTTHPPHHHLRLHMHPRRLRHLHHPFFSLSFHISGSIADHVFHFRIQVQHAIFCFFPAALFRVGSRGQQFQQRRPDFPDPSHSAHLVRPRGLPRTSTQSLQHVLGLLRGLFPLGYASSTPPVNLVLQLPW